MDDIDMECYIMPRVVPYLQHTIIQLREEVGGARRSTLEYTAMFRGARKPWVVLRILVDDLGIIFQ